MTNNTNNRSIDAKLKGKMLEVVESFEYLV